MSLPIPPGEIARDISEYVQELKNIVEANFLPEHSTTGREALRIMRVKHLFNELLGASDALKEQLYT